MLKDMISSEMEWRVCLFIYFHADCIKILGVPACENECIWARQNQDFLSFLFDDSFIIIIFRTVCFFLFSLGRLALVMY